MTSYIFVWELKKVTMGNRKGGDILFTLGKLIRFVAFLEKLCEESLD